MRKKIKKSSEAIKIALKAVHFPEEVQNVIGKTLCCEYAFTEAGEMHDDHQVLYLTITGVALKYRPTNITLSEQCLVILVNPVMVNLAGFPRDDAEFNAVQILSLDCTLYDDGKDPIWDINYRSLFEPEVRARCTLTDGHHGELSVSIL